MPWQGQGGGGGNNGGGGPWGGGPSPWGRPPQSPKLDELLRRGQDRFRRILPGGFGTGAGIGLVVAVVCALWLVSGFYRVLPDEVGVVLRFGAYNRITGPGLNYHVPAPIESVLTPKVTRVNRVEIGFRAGGEGPSVRAATGRQVPEEALMLTGDENIVDINFTVFWVIKDAQAYLFNLRNPEGTVKAAAESAMREVIGQTPIAPALAEGRGKIESDTQRLLQQILDSYGSGIAITQVQLQRVDPPAPVIDAFRDVQRAKADQVRLANEADAYQNDILPRAHGEAVRLVQESEAYKQQVVAKAQGEAQRFLSVYNAYKAAEDVTARRLYIETMEELLRNTNKIIIDKAATASGVVPYLPLPELAGRPLPPPAPGSSAAAIGSSGSGAGSSSLRGARP